MLATYTRERMKASHAAAFGSLLYFCQVVGMFTEVELPAPPFPSKEITISLDASLTPFVVDDCEAQESDNLL